MASIDKFRTKIQGKDYLMVAGRVILAHEKYPEAISMVSDVVYEDENVIRVRGVVTIGDRAFVAHAQSYKQSGSAFEKRSPLEVAETSAYGRAFGFAGLGIEDGIASADEVNNAIGRDERPNNATTPIPIPTPIRPAAASAVPPATKEAALKDELRGQAWSLMERFGVQRGEAGEYIKKWSGKTPDLLTANDWADLVADLQSKVR